jgi:hypothetical protein
MADEMRALVVIVVTTLKLLETACRNKGTRERPREALEKSDVSAMDDKRGEKANRGEKIKPASRENGD